MLKCFKRGGDMATLLEAHVALKRLGESQFMQLVGEGLAGVLESCTTYTDQLLRGLVPDLKKLGTGTFVTKLKRCLLDTQVLDLPSGQRRRGLAAIEGRLKNLQEDMEGEAKPTFASTIALRQFAAFLDADKYKALKGLTDALIPALATDATAASSSGAASSMVPFQASDTRKKRKAKDSTMDAINALFVNSKSVKTKSGLASMARCGSRVADLFSLATWRRHGGLTMISCTRLQLSAIHADTEACHWRLAHVCSSWKLSCGGVAVKKCCA